MVNVSSPSKFKLNQKFIENTGNFSNQIQSSVRKSCIKWRIYIYCTKADCTVRNRYIPLSAFRESREGPLFYPCLRSDLWPHKLVGMGTKISFAPDLYSQRQGIKRLNNCVDVFQLNVARNVHLFNSLQTDTIWPAKSIYLFEP